MPEGSQEVMVLQTADLTEVRLARNLFEQAGIPCRVAGGGDSALLGAVLGSSFGGLHTVWVPAALEAAALELLDSAWPEPPPAAS